MSSLRSQTADKDKALRGVKSQMQEAQDDVVKLTDKLAEVKSQKAKFSRLAREKGEEIGEQVGGDIGCKGHHGGEIDKWEGGHKELGSKVTIGGVWGPKVTILKEWES